MKKKLQSIIKTVTIIVLFALAGAALWFATQTTQVSYQADTSTGTAPVVEMESDVAKAERMLAEATAKLNAEETKLLEEKAQIEAEAAAKVAEIESKIEQINQVRSSF